MSGVINTKEALDKEQGKFNGVIQSLTKAAIAADYETKSFDSFEDFCLQIISDIPKSSFSKPLRVKCIYDKKGNPTLPAYGVTFEDPSVISADKSRIKIYDKDILVKVEMDKDEVETIDLSIDKKEETDDLPWKV